jgi:signal transduction histidine kinase/ligand-binding sensor domain-containing protein/DNA-binding response OmpR family regulator
MHVSFKNQAINQPTTMRLPGLLLLFFFCLPWHVFPQKAANQFRRIDNQKGLSNNHVNTIFSDSRGYLWFATISGLNRYDGYSFRVFKNDPADTTSISNNSMHNIFEDHLGFLWFFNDTGQYNIYDPATERFSRDHEIFHKKFSLPHENIIAIKSDAHSRLWIGNSQEGLFVYTPKDDHLHQISGVPGDAESLSGNHITNFSFGPDGKAYVVHISGIVDVIDPTTLKVIERLEQNIRPSTDIRFHDYRIFVDSDNDVWIYSLDSGDGLYYLNRAQNKWNYFTPFSGTARISSQIISGLVQDNTGRIWVGTDHGGINIINKKDFSVSVLINVPGDVTSLSGNSITSLHKSREGIIWAGTFKNGVNYYHEHFYQFDHYRSGPFQESEFFSNDVNCFAEDKQGNLWIGTNGGGLVYFNRSNNTFRTYRHQPGNPKSLSNDIIVSMLIDHQDRLWIGTYQGGLNRMDGQNFTDFRHNPSDATSLADDRVWQILQDKRGRIWVGTLGGGLDLFDDRTNGFVHHRASDYNSVSADFILTLYEDSKGNIWIGSTFGVNVLDAETQRFRHYQHQENDPNSLSNNHVLSMLEDLQGRMWIGTRNGLNLYDKENDKFAVYDEKDGLPDHNIISLQEDSKGNIWIATLNGLSNMVFDKQGKTMVFHNYDMLEGLQGREFNEHSSLRTSKGELIFGGANGFNIFIPENIHQPKQHYDVILSDFKLFNRSVAIGEQINGSVLLNKTISLTPQITLRNNQNVFSIGFSALNFFHPERTRFRYMLEGFHNEWLETDASNRVATFTNLNPGKYTFKVKAQGSDGTWSDYDTQIQIVVVPPFYATRWAYILYYVLLVALIFLLVFTIQKREKTKFLRRQEKTEYSRMRDLDAMKTRFFTNVSHEFRTPLTLILTPLEKLLKETSDESLRSQLEMIQRNGKRLLSLVNQLLDFRKLEKNKITINPVYTDVVKTVQESFVSFTDLFDSKNISYNFSANTAQYHVSFDPDKMEKIIFNLLSNAVKFTPENGSIELLLKRCVPSQDVAPDFFANQEYIEIQVRDTGIGIAPERLDKVFERFFQSTENKAVINQGSGIGLAITLEFVKMHNGTIDVESKPGLGSCFTVRMPLQTTSAQPESDIQELQLTNPQRQDHKQEESLQKTNKPIVLLVEDNEDLRFYLKENLKSRYKIIEAANGGKGWEMIISHMPHLVVSDIMMPVEDGISLCRRIKKDQRTSHIPVILLTARGSKEQKLEGLEAGAEDYITKPFSYEILELKIRHLVELRLSFQKLFSQKFEIEPGEINITSLDEKFLSKALEITEKNIENTEFSVEKMGRELGVSRGHLYNKLVALTGKTPVEFIRIMRLKRAAQLLGKSQLTVSEIAFRVGFNDPKYFSKYFKDEFGVVPSVYAKKHQ